jgi:hypothetical protein
MADQKLSDLTALTTPSGDDILYVVDDPAGTPADRKIALDNLFTRGTVTVSSPVIDAAQTWNDGAVTFTGLKFNATDTASAAASLLMDLQVGGTSKANISKTGNLRISGTVLQLGQEGGTTTEIYSGTSGAGNPIRIGGIGTLSTVGLQVVANSLTVRSVTTLGWTSGTAITSDADLTLRRRGEANLAFGAADAATASVAAQTLSVQSVKAGNTNGAGKNLTITGSQGTGTGAGGSIIFQVAPAGSSGSAQNALADALTINSAGLATFADAVRTSAPSGGTAANWKLGTVATVTPTLQNRTIEVDIGGTIYYISAKTTND